MVVQRFLVLILEGIIEIPKEIGLGMEIDEAKIESESIIK